MKRHSKDMRGFTLLELLMVIIIIAILAAIALPQYTRTRERAGAAEALVMLGSIRQSELREKEVGTGAYVTVDKLDIAVPVSATDGWDYGTTGIPIDHATADRKNPAVVGQVGKIHINLDTGCVYGDDAVWGQGTTVC